MDPLLNEEQQALREAARQAAMEMVAPLADDIDREGVVPAGLFAKLGEAGLLEGASGGEATLRLTLALEQIARKSGAVALVVAGHSLALTALREAGSDAGVDALAGGRNLACLVTGGVVSVDGEGRLSGEAELVTGAALADVLVVVAVADHGDAGLYRVDSGAEGLAVGDPEELMGLHGAGIATIELEDCPAERLGDVAAATAAGQRLCVAQAAVAVGLARGALDVSVAEVAARSAAGDPVDRSQAVQWMLADIATESEAARAATWYAACQAPGTALSEASSMCRLLAAEAAVQSTRRALQIFGSRGGLRAAGVERLYRDAKLMEIQGGTNEEQLARIADHLLPDIAGA